MATARSLSLEDQAYQHIRRQLLTGRLPAGTRVSDLDMAAEMGVSRTPVREALLRLRNEGFVEQIPRLGTFVRTPTLEDLMEMHELRRVLESHAVMKAARRATRADLQEARQLCVDLLEVAREVRDRELTAVPPEVAQRGVLADVRFHLLILRAAGNRRMQKITSDLHLLSHLCGHNWGNPETMSLLSRTAHTALDHWRIMRALERRDPKAARFWMLKHIRPLREVVADMRVIAHRLATNEQVPNDWPQTVRDGILALEFEAAPSPEKPSQRRPTRRRKES